MSVIGAAITVFEQTFSVLSLDKHMENRMERMDAIDAVNQIGVNLDAVINLVLCERLNSAELTRQDIATVLNLVRQHVATVQKDISS